MEKSRLGNTNGVDDVAKRDLFYRGAACSCPLNSKLPSRGNHKFYNRNKNHLHVAKGRPSQQFDCNHEAPVTVSHECNSVCMSVALLRKKLAAAAYHAWHTDCAILPT